MTSISSISSKSSKSSKSKKIVEYNESTATAIEKKIAYQVENAINYFFNIQEMKCLTVAYDKLYNYEYIIKELCKCINTSKMTLSDVNVNINGIITDIRIKADNNEQIEIKYYKNAKYYTIYIYAFINNIYICDNKIFLLISAYKFNKEKTLFYNSIIKQRIDMKGFEDIINKCNDKNPVSYVAIDNRKRQPVFFNLPKLFNRNRNPNKDKDDDELIKLKTDIIMLYNIIDNLEISIQQKIEYLNNKIEEIKRIELNKELTQQKINKINIYFNNLKKEVTDKILMPPPQAAKKQRREGGTNKKITRKIYIDNKGKLYIKFKKDIIIYLKK